VANIFKLGTKYTQPFNFQFIDQDGSKKLVLMGCYGIGPSRLMGTIVEVFHDEKGIIWPEQVAPFNIHLIQIENDQKVKKAAEKLYQNLQKQGVEVLYDDRNDKSPGEKFTDADLIGIPTRMVISQRTLKENSVEVKSRSKEETKLIKINHFCA